MNKPKDLRDILSESNRFSHVIAQVIAPKSGKICSIARFIAFVVAKRKT
jgi:hypothetical protein